MLKKNKLSTPKSETQESSIAIPKTENSGLTPSTQAARQARASMLKQWKTKIKNVIPKTPDNNLLSTSLVSFDLDDESRTSQQNQPLRPVDKLQKRLFQRSNSITSSLSTNPEESLSQNTSSNDSKNGRKHVDILVRTENPETKVVELVRETISVEDKPVLKKKSISSKEKLRSCLKKKIFKMKDQSHQERLKNHELKLEDYNKQFEGDDFEFDENEETMINSSSQKHNAQMTGSTAYTEESLSSHALDPAGQPLGPLWEESEVDDEMAKLLAPNSRSAAEVDNLTFIDGASSLSQQHVVNSQKAIRRGLNLPTQKRNHELDDLDFEITQMDKDSNDELSFSGEELIDPVDLEKKSLPLPSDDDLSDLNSDRGMELSPKVSESETDTDDEFFKQIRKRREIEEADDGLEVEIEVKQTSNSTASVSGNETAVRQLELESQEPDSDTNDGLQIIRPKSFTQQKLALQEAKNLFAEEADLSDEENGNKFKDSQEDEEGSDLDNYEEEQNDEVLPDAEVIKQNLDDKFKRQERIDDAQELALLKEAFGNQENSDEEFDIPKVERFNWNDQIDDGKFDYRDSDDDEDHQKGVELKDTDEILNPGLKMSSKFTMEPDENAIEVIESSKNIPEENKENFDSTKPLFNVPTTTKITTPDLIVTAKLPNKSVATRFFNKFGDKKSNKAKNDSIKKVKPISSFFIEESKDGHSRNDDSKSKFSANGMTFSSAKYSEDSLQNSASVSKWGDDISMGNTKKRKGSEDNASLSHFTGRLFKRQKSGDANADSLSSKSSSLFKSFAKT